MAFMKVLKTPAFFKRYQVPKRRRRQGKTDFAARRRMIHLDKNKYNARKHRLVVRITNTKIICQVVYATIAGDVTVCQATSPELANYGIAAGYKNYAAAYATGLLVARRILKQFGMDANMKGVEEADGEEFHIEEEEYEGDSRPFKAILDVGIRDTSQGVRLWGALKGAVDGGLHVPHTIKKFPGYSPPTDKGGEPSYEAEVHKEAIFGGRVSEYMSSMQDEDPTKYEAHFAKYIEAGKDSESLEEMYADAHKKIRADPTMKASAKKGITWSRSGEEVKSSDGKTVVRSKKIGLDARKEKVLARIAAAQEAMADA